MRGRPRALPAEVDGVARWHLLATAWIACREAWIAGNVGYMYGRDRLPPLNLRYKEGLTINFGGEYC